MIEILIEIFTVNDLITVMCNRNFHSENERNSFKEFNYTEFLVIQIFAMNKRYISTC